MAIDTLTLGLTGELTLAQHAAATQNLQRLVLALSKLIAKKHRIEWLLDNLSAGSAVTTARAEAYHADDLPAIEAVISAYEAVGDALAHDTTIPYPPAVEWPARAIVGLLNRHISTVRFETPNRDITILSEQARQHAPAAVSSYDAVEGRVQTLTNRKSLRFTLYESISDRPVSCYLREGGEEEIRNAWGRRVIVEGWVSRDPLTGLPASVRRITNIEVLPDVPAGSFRAARGAVPRLKGEPLAEEIIRLIRDA